MFAAAGLKLDDFLAAGDDSTLQAHLASLTPAPAPAVAAAPVTEAPEYRALAAELTQLRADHTATTTRASTAEARLAVYVEGLAQARITVPAPAAGVELTAADVAGAVDARVGVRVAELNGRLGEQPPVVGQISNDPARAPRAASNLTGIARVHAALVAQRQGRN